MTGAPRFESRKRDSRAAKNPHAEGIPPEELSSLVEEFYGTRTLVFDRAFAEAVLTYNTANRRINRRKLAVLAQQMVSGQN